MNDGPRDEFNQALAIRLNGFMSDIDTALGTWNHSWYTLTYAHTGPARKIAIVLGDSEFYHFANMLTAERDVIDL